MPSKKVQTLLRNPNERKHRHHRSKRGQNPRGTWGIDGRLSQRDRKRKLTDFLEEELKEEIYQVIIEENMAPILELKAGQVWKMKPSDSHTGGATICIVGVSRDSKQIYVTGLMDVIDPLFSVDYLLSAYELDNNF